jgi:hypothetical protein
MALKFLRSQQRVKKIGKQQQRGRSTDEIVHGYVLLRSEPIASLCKKPEQDEEEHGDQNVNQIQHDFTINARA